MKRILLIIFIILTYTYLFSEEVINITDNKAQVIETQPIKDETTNSASPDIIPNLSEPVQTEQSTSDIPQTDNTNKPSNPITDQPTTQPIDKPIIQTEADKSKENETLNLSSPSSIPDTNKDKAKPIEQDIVLSPFINADIQQLSPPPVLSEEEKEKTNSLLTKIFDDQIPLIPKEKSKEQSIRTLITSREIKKSTKPQQEVEVIEEFNYYPKQKEEILKDYKLEGYLNINTADIDQLQMLPMIDYRRALAIVEHRKQNGEFKNLIDIESVLGIDNIIFSKIFPYITLTGANTLKYVKIKK